MRARCSASIAALRPRLLLLPCTLSATKSVLPACQRTCSQYSPRCTSSFSLGSRVQNSLRQWSSRSVGAKPVRWQSVQSLSPGSSTNGWRIFANCSWRSRNQSSLHGPLPEVMSPMCTTKARSSPLRVVDQAVEPPDFALGIRRVAHQREAHIAGLARLCSAGRKRRTSRNGKTAFTSAEFSLIHGIYRGTIVRGDCASGPQST